MSPQHILKIIGIIFAWTLVTTQLILLFWFVSDFIESVRQFYSDFPIFKHIAGITLFTFLIQGPISIVIGAIFLRLGYKLGVKDRIVLGYSLLTVPILVFIMTFFLNMSVKTLKSPILHCRVKHNL